MRDVIVTKTFIVSEAEECVDGKIEDLKNTPETTRHPEDGSLQPTIDQAQQTTPGIPSTVLLSAFYFLIDSLFKFIGRRIYFDEVLGCINK